MLTEVKGYRTPVFLTFRQAKERGLTVRKGSKQFPVVFWKPFYQANNPTDGQRRYLTVEEYNALPESARAEYVLRFSLRYYPVLNLDQTDFEERFPEQWQKLLERQSMTPRPSGSVHPVLERLLAAQSWVCPILQKSGDAAFYSPCDDRIVLPRQEQFHDLEAFYSTMLHEMAHSTGSAGRLDRHLGEPSTAAYGREELVAEFSAALVGLGLGVSSGIRAENVAYLKAWLRELREKPVFIFSVLSDVQQVVRFFEEELCMRLSIRLRPRMGHRGFGPFLSRAFFRRRRSPAPLIALKSTTCRALQVALFSTSRQCTPRVARESGIFSLGLTGLRFYPASVRIQAFCDLKGHPLHVAFRPF